MKKAISISSEADILMAILNESGMELKEAINNGNQERVKEKIHHIYRLSEDLAHLEESFSITISNGANFVTNLIVVTTFSLFTLIFLFLFFYMRNILEDVGIIEYEINRSESEQRSLIRALPDLIWMKNIDGVYLKCNKRFEEFFGAKEEEIIGKTDFDFVDFDLANFFRENDLKAIENEKATVNQEEITFASDGHKEYLETIKTPLYGENGNVVGILGIGRDLSQYIKTQKELEDYKDHLENLVSKRTEELELMVIKSESGNRAKSEFLANMSHEIRTPMTAIIGMTALAMRTDDEDKKKSYIHKCHDSANRLLGIINDILDFSKIEAGKLDIEMIMFKLEEVVSNIEILFKPKIEEKKQILSITIDPTLPSVLVGDPLRLGQILLNLVGNAIKFTPDKGSIDLSINLLEEDSDHCDVYFSVADTGVGIPKEFHTELFDAFNQGDNSVTRKFGGTGLGLAISKSLIDMMNGEIHFNNNQSGGATFCFRMQFKKVCLLSEEQLKACEEAEKKQLASAIESLEGAKILLVEDMPENQEIISEFLEMEGVEVEFASNGKEAIEKIIAGDYDGVLMDCQMPVMDGYEATAKIREMPAYSQLPIIAITGNVMKEDIDKIKKSGMNDYIAKPIDLESFYITIAKTLRS